MRLQFLRQWKRDEEDSYEFKKKSYSSILQLDSF